MLNKSLTQQIENSLGNNIKSVQPVTGGCINSCYQLTLLNDRQFFLKTHDTVASFPTEAAGLNAINTQVTGFAPEVILVDDNYLLLEFLETAPACNSFYIQLGKNLAQLHQKTNQHFGFEHDNYCGKTIQINKYCEDGYEFFINHRILYQTKLAYDNQLLDLDLVRKINHLCKKLETLIPPMPAVLLHGDLWSGNVLSSTQGAKIVDPACYYGWAEADMAMTCLFGDFANAFYKSYEAASGIDSSWRSRAPLYNLYHLLNHLNLFGNSYAQSVKSVVNQYQ